MTPLRRRKSAANTAAALFWVLRSYALRISLGRLLICLLLLLLALTPNRYHPPLTSSPSLPPEKLLSPHMIVGGGPPSPPLILVPQMDKSGSSTLRLVFAARNNYYGGKNTSDARVANELRRRGCPLGTKAFLDYEAFWKVMPQLNSECTRAVTWTARKLWDGHSQWPNNVDGGEFRPLPVMQMSSPCPAEMRENYEGGGGCKRLLQFREPLSWVRSHYDYFCVRCLDKNKFCGRLVDASCGPKHELTGDHETIQSWARKYGNIFTRMLHKDDQLRIGGTYVGGMHVKGWGYPLGNTTIVVEKTLEIVKREGHCAVALEDPDRMGKIAECLGDPPDLYARLGFDGDTASNRERSTREGLAKEVVKELEEILSPDIKLYEALFPHLQRKVEHIEKTKDV